MWADPERSLSVALATSEKPLVAEHLFPLAGFFFKTSTLFRRTVTLPALAGSKEIPWRARAG